MSDSHQFTIGKEWIEVACYNQESATKSPQLIHTVIQFYRCHTREKHVHIQENSVFRVIIVGQMLLKERKVSWNFNVLSCWILILFIKFEFINSNHVYAIMINRLWIFIKMFCFTTSCVIVVLR